MTLYRISKSLVDNEVIVDAYAPENRPWDGYYYLETKADSPFKPNASLPSRQATVCLEHLWQP
jgi:hypothetical protein